MADDTIEDQAAPETGKAKRAPPTIELEATEVSDATRPSAEAAAEASATAPAPEAASAETVSPPAAPTSRPISAWVVAPFSGAVAAALVILVGWMLGWPAVKAPPPAPQVDVATVDDLGKRVAALEGRLDKLPPPVAAAVLQKPIKDLQDDVATLRAQVDKLAAAASEMKSAPQGATAATVDLSPLNERIAKIEEAVRASAAQESEKAAKAQDDLPLRRLVAAALLDVAVRHGDPYATALATAKTLSPNPDALKPLDQFAEKGVPAPPALTRELSALVPKLSPPAEGGATTDSGIIGKLEAGAARLVRVERTDSTGNDRAAIVARVTAAAIRNDFGDARRELESLAPADRAPAQAWLDRAAARDAALAASRQFADEAMAGLARTGQ